MTAQLAAYFGLAPPPHGAKWMLSGAIQSGKTTCLERLIRDLRQATPPWRVGGLVCPGIYHGGTKVACRGYCCRSGDSFLLGVRQPLSDEIREPLEQEFGPGCCRQPGQIVGSWLLFDGGLERAAEAIMQAVAASCDLVAADEFGPRELSGRGLRPAVDQAVAAGAPLLLVVRETLVEPVRDLYGEFHLLRVPVE
jgi:nucleoside-triphosphatase THEP1